MNATTIPKAAGQIIVEAGAITKTCACSATVVIDGWLAKFAEHGGVMCNDCCDRANAESSRKALENSRVLRDERWSRICPPGFVDTVPHKLPHPHQLQLVLGWQYGPTGLLLHGATGKGKSRCAWMLLKREWEAGRSIACLSASSGLKYGALFSDSSRSALEWVQRRAEVDILLMDDAFKAKLTDSFEAALFSVITQRTENKLPIIVTSNDNAASLTERITEDRSAAMLRRLKEFCRVITFPS